MKKKIFIFSIKHNNKELSTSIKKEDVQKMMDDNKAWKNFMNMFLRQFEMKTTETKNLEKNAIEILGKKEVEKIIKDVYKDDKEGADREIRTLNIK